VESRLSGEYLRRQEPGSLPTRAIRMVDYSDFDRIRASFRIFSWVRAARPRVARPLGFFRLASPRHDVRPPPGSCGGGLFHECFHLVGFARGAARGALDAVLIEDIDVFDAHADVGKALQ